MGWPYYRPLLYQGSHITRVAVKPRSTVLKNASLPFKGFCKCDAVLVGNTIYYEQSSSFPSLRREYMNAKQKKKDSAAKCARVDCAAFPPRFFLDLPKFDFLNRVESFRNTNRLDVVYTSTLISNYTT